MAANVKFLKGTQAEYNSSAKNADSFYYLTDTAMLYLGTIKLSNAADLANAVTNITQNATDIASIQTQLTTLVGTGNGSISKMISDALAPVNTNIGTLGNLATSNKTDLVSAINEVNSKTGAVAHAGTVTLEESEAGYLKSYTIKQGSTTVGTIDIPSDMVVKSGTVVTNPPGKVGTYIELTLANTDQDKIYIDVETLVDDYKAQASAAQVQLTINSATRVISAAIVAGGVGTTELATDAVTTVKIKNANVTKAKLETSVQTSLNKADSAVQTVTTGESNGTIKVDGTPVAVYGLGSAAYMNSADIKEAADKVEAKLDAYRASNDSAVTGNTSAIAAINNTTTGILAQAKSYADTQDATTLASAKTYADGLASNYATAAQGAKADSALQQSDITTGTANGTFKVKGTAVAVFGLKSAAYTDASAYDPAGTGQAAANTALATAKEYTDTCLTWGTIS